MFDKVGPTINDVSNELDMSLVSDMARDDRKERSIPLDKNLFIAVAWTYRGKSCLKFIFLEVFHLFTTSSFWTSPFWQLKWSPSSNHVLQRM